MIKISFLGDILCQLPFLKAAQKRGNDFYTAFEGLQPLLQDSDYVVANLETPIAGEEAGYTNDVYSFNTPAEFLDALKRLKIDLYLTANNHCLDRGVTGLKNTLRELDNRQMAHTGTGPTRYHLAKIGDTTIAFLNYTACVNEDKWNLYGHELEQNDLNLLIDIDKYLAYRTEKRKQNIPLYTLRKKLGRAIPKSLQLKLKSTLGIKQHPTFDNEPLDAVAGAYLERVKRIIAEAKSEADLVILLPHCGGQFNTKPGKLSQEIFNTLFDFGADAVIGNHPHTIQENGLHDDKPYAYSLGNVSFSPSYPFQVKESKPEVGMIFHFYVEGKKIIKTTLSLFKTIETHDHYQIIKPEYKLCDNMSVDIPKEVRDFLHEIRKNTRIRECIYPDHTNCNEIAHAHSIQDSKIREKLAEGGKVIMLERKSNFSYDFGHNEASVFTGFCKHHDQMLFRPIEYYPFTKSFEQIFLYTYRAFAYSYHKKKEELLQNINLYNHPKCFGFNKGLASSLILSSAISIHNFEEEKLLFDDALLSKDYNVLSGLIWTFEGESNFASVGYKAMPIDFDGNIIQDFNNPINGIRNIYITIFPENGKTHSIITWLNLSSPVYKTVYDKLYNLTEKERKNFINNTIPVYTNNCAFKPSFYESFHSDLREEFDIIFYKVLQLERSGKTYNWFDKPKFDLLQL